MVKQYTSTPRGDIDGPNIGLPVAPACSNARNRGSPPISRASEWREARDHAVRLGMSRRARVFFAETQK
jgi:hypothetical protein